jgi:hypothetical protein
MRVLLVILVAMLAVGCDSGFNAGAVSGKPFTTSRPASADIPGSYVLVSQNVTTNGLFALRGRSCRLELAPDGTFSITNYLPDLISATGRWRCETIGFDHGREMWGIRFDSSPPIEAAALSGSSAPYRLVMIFGDPDSDETMIYEKKK